MENHQLVVSKAAFAARLLRPDPTTVPRDEISAFHTSLERVLSHCSPTNVQICKAWLLRFVVLSSSRVGGLATYLEALAGSGSSQPTGSGVSLKRRKLHILYLLSDILHHCKYHLDTTAAFSTVTGSLQPHIVNLVGHAAAYDRQKNPRLHRRLDTLLDVWSEHKYFHPDLVGKLREVVINSATIGFTPSTNDTTDAEDPTKKSGKEESWIMPAIHGDPSTPWYDLPAGCWLPHIIPHNPIPIRPADIKPVRVQPGPASPRLIHAVKESIEYANRLYDSENPLDDATEDLDALGQVVNGERYYGWSVEFCEKMKKDPDDSSTGSRSRSGSPYPKRRRYSDSSIDRSESQSPPRCRPNQPEIHRHHDSHARAPHSENPYRQEPSTSHFPPPHDPSHHPPAPANSFPPPHNPNAQYSRSQMPPHAGYAQQPVGNYGSWPAPQHMSTMPFPNPGPGYSPSAFPPQYQHPSSMPFPTTQGQGQGHAMPPGQYHFPPPYYGGQQGQPGGPWGPPPGGRG
ncbi:RNA polymerase II large subunit CTD [Penicillium bovifimosum]|uniref:RNA polymerase II large subunit CTD n=1 Tax=Penicillium bovifimosum TaxID=126998 RepID=A0A9W9HIJ7_9EURO|nr:RNA polymerase II large subunit CTD [Penicillium bovifimosum]KAJ5146415.1 RNA polymerase II large subunit CTD [Penicillium bovifimosum]